MATVLGFLLYPNKLSVGYIISAPWLKSAIFIGILFFVIFVFIGYATKHIGIAITTIAGKMSMTIPILFSIFFFHEEVFPLKVIGLILAFIAVILSSHQHKVNKLPMKFILLPIIIFIGSGLTDSIVKYAQHLYVQNDETFIFASTVFLTSFIIATLYIVLIDNKLYQFKNISLWKYGIGLGVVNFGSLYFFVQALNTNIIDSSIVFGINNLGIVALSIFIGILIFSEKFTKINILGFGLSILSIVILTIL